MKSILPKMAKDNRFEVNNNTKYILVISMTDIGRCSFVKFKLLVKIMNVKFQTLLILVQQNIKW